MSMNRDRLQHWTEQADRCRAAGDYRRAGVLYRRAVGAAEQALGRNAAEVALLLNNLGVVCKYLGRFREAGRHYRRALMILETIRETSPVTRASLYHNLGGLEHVRGRCAGGEPFARRSVALRAEALGPRHPDVAADLAALAALLDGQG